MSADADPAALSVRECKHPDCTGENGLQIVQRLEGDYRVYCPLHRDRNWGAKTR